MEGLFLTRVADVDCAAGRSIEGRFRRALQFLVILQFLQQASNFQGPPCNAKLGVNFLLVDADVAHRSNGEELSAVRNGAINSLL